MNKSVNNIIDALGGTSKLANLLGVNPSAVSNYRQKGFPARLHLKIIALCEEFSIPIDNEFIDKSKIPLKVIKSNSNEFLTHKSNSIMSSLSSDGYQLVDPPILVPADKVIDRLLAEKKNYTHTLVKYFNFTMKKKMNLLNLPKQELSLLVIKIR